MLIFPSFESSKVAEKIPAFPVLFRFLDDKKLVGIKSFISFQSDSLPKKVLILLIPASVVKTGNFGIFIL